jgi:hypothetical protein
MFEAVGADGNGSIDIDEYMAWCAPFQTEEEYI